MSPSGTASAGVADPIADPARLQVLRATGLLDIATAAPSLDRLTRLAARLVGAPVALVSLIDVDRQVFASAVGLDEPLATERQTPLSQSWCRHVVSTHAPLIINDAVADPRVCDSLTDGKNPVRSYAGFPLLAPDDQVLGSFCVADTHPRHWTAMELSVMQDLAAAASAEIALRLAHAEQSRTAARLQTVLDGVQDAFVSIDTAGAVTAWNAAAENLFGWSATEVIGEPLTELIIPARFREAHERGLAAVRDSGTSALAGQRLELAAVDRTGREFPIELTLQVSHEQDEPVFHAFLHDISDRKAAQQQLEHERTFLQTLLDSLDTGVVACDSDGKLALFNQALRGAHQAGEEPIGAEQWADAYDLFAPDGRRQLRPEEVPLARAFAGEHVQGEEMVVRVPGSPPRRFLANGRPIDTADGRRLGAVVAMHDITEQHRVEVFRAAQHAVAHALADADNADHAATATVAAVAGALGWGCGEYWHVHTDTGGGERIVRVGSWTTPERDLSAFTSDEPATFGRGEGLPGLVWATGTDQWIRDMPTDAHDFTRRHEALQAGLHAAIGLPVRSGNRVLGVLTFFADTIEDPDGELLGLLDGICAHVGRHIERRRGDELTLALAAARRDFDRVIEQVNDYVWTVEITADGSTQSVYASPNGSGVFGDQLPTDADMAAAVAERVHPEDLPAFHQFHHTLSSGEPAEVECRIIGFDAVTRWVWTRATPRRDDDRLFVDGISTNITDRRQLAEQREQLLNERQQQLDRLRELDRMKDELVAVVSHELCNPIAAIRGYAEMLLDADLDGDTRHFTEAIDRHSARLQELVDDLLDLARLDAGHVTIDARPTPLDELIRQAVEDHRHRADAKQLVITIDVPPHLPVHADPARLRQVLDNLLSNAVKYTPTGGAITISARLEGGTAQVCVSDTGIGIPADQYPHLFSRFFRASTATEQGIKGTGLGLAIAKAMINAHHGTITAHPAHNGGTTFTIELPTTAVTADRLQG